MKKKKVWQDYVFNKKVRIAVPAILFLTLSYADLRYIYSRPRVYESHAKIWIQTKISTANQQSPFFNSPIATAAEVMKSSTVLSEARNLMQKDAPGLPLPDIDALHSVRISPVSDTDVLEVSYLHGDPRVAYHVVNSIMSAFIQTSIRQTAASAVQSRVFLQKQLNDTKRQHAELEQSKKTFQQSKGINVVKDADEISSQISGLRTQILASQVKLRGFQEQIRTLTHRLQLSPDSLAEVQNLSRDDVLNRLRERLSEHSFNLEEAKTKYSATSPRISRIEKSIEKLRQAIADRYKLLYNKEIPLQQQELPKAKNDMRDEIHSQLNEAQLNERQEQQQLNELQVALSSLQSRLQMLPAVQSEFLEINRAEKVATEAISNVERELNEAQLNESIAKESSNVQIIELPVIAKNAESAGGKKLFLISEALLFVFSGVIFYLLMFLDPHVYSAKRVLGLLPGNVVGIASDSSPVIPLNRLRMNLEGWVNGEPFLIINPHENEESTQVGLALAMSFANCGKSVALISLFDQRNDEALQFKKNLRFYGPTELAAINSLEVTQGESWFWESHLEELLKNFRAQAEVVIFDCPSLSGNHNTLTILNKLKKAVVVVELGQSTVNTLKEIALAANETNADLQIVLKNASNKDLLAIKDYVHRNDLLDAASKFIGTANW